MSLIFCLSLAATALAASGSATKPDYPAFRNTTLNKIEANSIAVTSKSWELGTNFAALTYLHAYKLSEFGTASFPVNASAGKLPAAIISALDDVLDRRSSGLKAFMADGAPADPASMLPAAVLAGITTGDNKYLDAARDQVDYLLNSVPRYTDNITMSHRSSKEPFQAWADSVFMVPPTLGAWAAHLGGNDGEELMWHAYAQIKGYRTLLRDPATNLWRHIVEGNWEDRGFWLTGNAWAAFGALRLEAIITKSDYADNMITASADLRKWTDQILNATWSRQERSGGLKNYLEQDTFEDSAGLTLLAAATYRYSLITKSDKYIPFAEKAFERLLELVDNDGWVSSPVDPYNFRTVGRHSPEAQSFLLILHVMSQKYYQWQESPGRVLATALLQGLSLKKTAAA